MAALDRIYVDSYEKYLEFKEWCKKQPLFTDKYGKQESMTKYLITGWDPEDWKSHPIASFPYYIDAYVIRNCPFDYIQKELMLRYGHKDQESIDEAYEIVMKRGGVPALEYSEPYWWMSEDDFKVIDGVVTFPENENSSYMRIKRGEVFNSPITDAKYEVGKHFKCTKHPVRFYNRPAYCKSWWVQITPPSIGVLYLTYHENLGTWDFSDEYVISDWGSNTAFVKTIKALKRKMRKWKLPIGTIVHVTGRYVGDYYEFKITK